MKKQGLRCFCFFACLFLYFFLFVLSCFDIVTMQYRYCIDTVSKQYSNKKQKNKKTKNKKQTYLKPCFFMTEHLNKEKYVNKTDKINF